MNVSDLRGMSATFGVFARFGKRGSGDWAHPLTRATIRYQPSFWLPLTVGSGRRKSRPPNR